MKTGPNILSVLDHIKQHFKGHLIRTRLFTNFGVNEICFFYMKDYKIRTLTKELTHCHKLWFSHPNIFATQCRKHLIFQTYIFLSNKSHSLKYQRFTAFEFKDIGIRKSEFVANSQFLWYLYSLRVRKRLRMKICEKK